MTAPCDWQAVFALGFVAGVVTIAIPVAAALQYAAADKAEKAAAYCKRVTREAAAQSKHLVREAKR